MAKQGTVQIRYNTYSQTCAIRYKMKYKWIDKRNKAIEKVSTSVVYKKSGTTKSLRLLRS